MIPNGDITPTPATTAAMLEATAKAIADWLEADDRPEESSGTIISIAIAALEAAGVPALLEELDDLRFALAMDAQRERKANE